MQKILLALMLCLILFIPRTTFAVPSPDLIIGIGTIIVQWVGIGIVLVLGVFTAMYRFLRMLFITSKWRFFGIVIGVPLFVIGMVTIFALYYQKHGAMDLVEQLKEQDASFSPVPSKSDKLVFDNEIIRVPLSEEKFLSHIDISDAGAQLIFRYYENIAYGKLDDAYAISHRKVSREVFGARYAQVLNISLDKLIKIDEENYSLELVLCENNQTCGRYGVLMTLAREGDMYTHIANSQVRSLELNNEKQERIEQKNISISNNELQKLLSSEETANVIILDAREDIEYENGRFPDSTHIRIADLKAGKWLDLDAEKTVIVLCWSGIRGKEVAEFLRSKELDARYVEDGAQGWVESGGRWEGGISIKEAYPQKQYSRLLACNEMRDEMKKNAFIVDSRERERYAKFHIPGSISIAMLSTPSSELEEAFAQIPQGSRVVTVCDGYVNCFDARVVGIESEKRGLTFLGRFTDLKCFR